MYPTNTFAVHPAFNVTKDLACANDPHQLCFCCQRHLARLVNGRSGCMLSCFTSIVANCNLRCYLRCIETGCLANEPGATRATGASCTKRWMSSPPVPPIQPQPQPPSGEATAGVTSLLEIKGQYEQKQLQALGHTPSSEDGRNVDKAATASTIPAVSPAIPPELCDIAPFPTTNSNSTSIKQQRFNDSDVGHFYMSLPSESGQAERRTPTQVRKAREENRGR